MFSFVRAERLRESPRRFAELAPDLMVEVKSPTDNLLTLREKVQNFLALGTQVGIVINPETHTVEVYRPGDEVAEPAWGMGIFCRCRSYYLVGRLRSPTSGPWFFF